MKELSFALQKYGITVSRQTLYEDIEVLNRYGFDIVRMSLRGRSGKSLGEIVYGKRP